MGKIKVIVSVIFIFLVILSGTSSAQRYGGFASPGVVELGGNISFTSTTGVAAGETGGTNSLFSFSPYVGYFFTDGFELGFNPFEIQSGNGYSSVLILVAPSYNFRTASVAYPFIEALLGYASVSDGSSRSGFSWGLRGGVKLALGGNSLLNLGLQYLQVTLDPSGATSRYGYNQFAFSAGFTVWF